jgi:alpha-mannosidase
MALTNPLIPVSPADDLSTKSLPPTQSFCSASADNVVISALKHSEADGANGGVILRAFETEGSPADLSLTCFGRQVSFREVNLLEDELPSSDRARDQHAAAEQSVVKMRPFEIRTVKLQLNETQHEPIRQK